MTFPFEWTGKRTPVKVIFPDTTEKTVQYMRDGLVMFLDGSFASYTRTSDFSAEFTTIETYQDKLVALEKYMTKQRFGQ